MENHRLFDESLNGHEGILRGLNCGTPTNMGKAKGKLTKNLGPSFFVFPFPTLYVGFQNAKESLGPILANDDPRLVHDLYGLDIWRIKIKTKRTNKTNRNKKEEFLLCLMKNLVSKFK